MNELQVFTYNDTPLRTVERDGEVWWVLKDVSDLLGIQRARDVASRLDDDEKGAAQIRTPGGMQSMVIINEPGLYNVILRSDKPEAKDFKRWVTHEVLPTIRSKGGYIVQPMSPAQLLAAQAQLLVEMEKRVDAVQSQTRELETKVDTAIRVFSRPAEDHWKADMDAAIKKLCEENGLSIPATRGRMYDELERAVNCSVSSRLARLRTRKRKAGARYRDAQALTKLDAISADKQLRAVFEGIVRQWQARAAVNAGNISEETEN